MNQDEKNNKVEWFLNEFYALSEAIALTIANDREGFLFHYLKWTLLFLGIPQLIVIGNCKL